MKKMLRHSFIAVLVIALAVAAPAPAHASWLSKAFKKVTTVLNPLTSPDKKLEALKDLKEDQMKNKFKAFKQAHEDGTELIVKTHENGTRFARETGEAGTRFAIDTGEAGTRFGVATTGAIIQTHENGTRLGLATTDAIIQTHENGTRFGVESTEFLAEHADEAAATGAILGAVGSPELMGTALTTATAAQSTADTAEVIDQNQQTIATLALVGSPEVTGTLLATNAAYQTTDAAATAGLLSPAVQTVASNDNGSTRSSAAGRRNSNRITGTAYQDACRRALGTASCWEP